MSKDVGAIGGRPSDTGFSVRRFFQGDAAREFTGSVFCPQRASSVAILRCAEYQSAKGCGLGCLHAATRAEIELVEINSRLDLDAESDMYFCPVCGQPKKSAHGLRCRRCAARLSGRGFKSRVDAP